jgi:hypothetical protein
MHVIWSKGGSATIVRLEQDRIDLASTIPSAPGSRLDGSVAGGGGSMRVKVARCVRTEGGFAILGRLIDTTRDVRLELEKLAVGARERQPPSG